MRLAIPSLSYRIWRDEGWIDPASFIQDTDSYLRWIFSEYPNEHAAGGLLIEADGVLWNSHDTIDSALNMASWFAAAVELLGGRPEVFVWAWEECSCYMRKDRFLIEIEERSQWVSYPTLRFPLADFMRELVPPGRLLLRLQRATAACIAEIEADSSDRELPSQVEQWAADIPPEYLAAPAFTAKARWEATRTFPLEEEALQQLQRELSIIERAVDAH